LVRENQSKFFGFKFQKKNSNGDINQNFWIQIPQENSNGEINQNFLDSNFRRKTVTGRSIKIFWIQILLRKKTDVKTK
jgi:hypothetical protein